MGMIRKFLIPTALTMAIVSGASAALAAPHSDTAAIKADVALNGIDPVSYFQGDGKPVAGSSAFSVTHDGKSYRFANQQNAEAFTASPNAFTPQYGGHCAWAAAEGSIAPGDPAFYRVVDGKLYLNYNAEVQARWVVDISEFITKADARWPSLKADME